MDPMSMTCPVHGPQKVREGSNQRGKYHYCSQWVGVGKEGANDKGYCSAKPVPLEAAPARTAPAAARTETVPQFTKRDDSPNREDQLRVAAIQFAGRIYAGSVPVGATATERAAIEGNAMRLADEAFVWLLGPEA
jgi:hypothetical protein